MINVLVIGYGVMTSGVIKRVVKNKKFNVTILSRHVSQDSDIRVIRKVSELEDVENVDIILTCFKNISESKKFFLSLINTKTLLCKPIFLDMSTSKISYVKYLKAIIEKELGDFVECPVTGSKLGSLNGDLSLFIHHSLEGEKKKKLFNLFNCISKKQYFFEEDTAPTKFKLLYNTWGAAILYTLKLFNPTSYDFSKKDESVALEIVKRDGWMSLVCSSKLDQINNKNFDDVHFKLEYMVKDLNYALEEVFYNNETKMIQYLIGKYCDFDEKYMEYDFSIIGKGDKL
ncbi:NAD(P)-binding domain-containing protein [Enterococcus rotai]|uniref:NAD(P)-binding domain-containing protein n=1 Tax=Enterococcus rotai TaxID=118060 RepID=UPI0032B54219